MDQVGDGKSSAPESGGYNPKLPWFKDCLNNALRHSIWILDGLCGVGLCEPCRLLPSSNILILRRLEENKTGLLFVSVDCNCQLSY